VLTALLLPVHTGNDICLLPLVVGRGHEMGPGQLDLSGGDACYIKPTIKGPVWLSRSLKEQTLGALFLDEE
jgi:hypothetical protein